MLHSPHDLVRSPLIGGELITTDQRHPVVNPSTGEIVDEILLGGAAEIDAAVVSAAAASKGWAALTAPERGRILRNIGAAISARAEELAEIESIDTGKPTKQSLSDVALAARYFEYYGSIVEALEGSVVDLGEQGFATVTNEPLGVTGHIVPWNYPIQIMCRSIAPSLAAGNTIVVKPAEDACLSTLLTAKIALDAGLPAGVFNIVPGLGAVAGQALADHPGIEHIAFTGSVPVGRHVAAAAAARGRASTLELGGKGAHLVLESANLTKALPVVLSTLLQNGGQTCSAGTRLVIHKSLHDEAMSMLRDLMSAVVTGPGLTDPDLGPLISQKQLDRVEGFVERAVASGAVIHAESATPTGKGGFFSPARVIGGVSPDSELAQEEIFGPVLTVLPFDDVDEGLAIVNGSRYGLTTGVWGADFQSANYAARRVDAGQVYVNGFVAGGGVQLPFGGYKDSGYGREKGAPALKAYTQSRTTVTSLS